MPPARSAAAISCMKSGRYEVVIAGGSRRGNRRSGRGNRVVGRFYLVNRASRGPLDGETFDLPTEDAAREHGHRRPRVSKPASDIFGSIARTAIEHRNARKLPQLARPRVDVDLGDVDRPRKAISPV